jgi:hypothetical protein
LGAFGRAMRGDGETIGISNLIGFAEAHQPCG